MRELFQRFFSSPAYAVVGASENRTKYGNIVYRYLRDKQFTVYPVNPNHSTVEGDTCYANVADLPADVQSVVFVVPPVRTERIVRECAAKGITSVWMQPGAESMDAIEYAQKHNMTAIYDACVMVVLSPLPAFSELHSWLKKIPS
ncbi:MAG: CoA-binding protein [bacterium]